MTTLSHRRYALTHHVVPARRLLLLCLLRGTASGSEAHNARRPVVERSGTTCAREQLVVVLTWLCASSSSIGAADGCLLLFPLGSIAGLPVRPPNPPFATYYEEPSS